MERPKVGVGVIIENKEGQILVGKRKGSHSPLYSIPGGHLELGETFEEAATKEIFEETGLQIFSPNVIAITNNLRTYRNEKVHYVSIILYANQFQGTPTIMEKEKCEMWLWVDPLQIPTPHFDASEFAIECFLKKRFYIPNQQ